MLHILLTILKIIGIVLLVIVGLILLILACVLFVPIRYGAFIRCNESNGKDLSAKVKVTYLLHIISLSVFYKEKKIDTELRICGFKTNLFDRIKGKDDSKSGENTAENKKNSKKRFNDKKKEKNGTELQTAEYDEDEVEIIESNFMDDFDNGTNRIHEKGENGNNELGADAAEQNVENKIKNKITQIISKIQYQFHNIYGKIKKAKENIGNLKEKAGKLKEKADSIKEFIKDDNTKLTFEFVKGQLKKVLNHISPKKVKGYIRFGFDDAYNTGRVLGVVYAVLRGGKENLNIYADFDNKVFETDIEMKGRMQIYYFVIVAVRIYRNSEFKKLLQRKKEFDSKNK